MNTFDEETKKQENELVDGQKKKAEEYNKELNEKYPPIKYSTDYLNGRAQEKNLAKIDEYKEAEKLKVINEELKKKETEVYELEKKANIKKNMETFENKQNQDRKCFLEKKKREREFLLSKKEKAFATLENKYKGKMQNLEGKERKKQNSNKENNE